MKIWNSCLDFPGSSILPDNPSRILEVRSAANTGDAEPKWAFVALEGPIRVNPCGYAGRRTFMHP